MHANDCSGDNTNDETLRTVDDTIAAVTLFGRMVDELRSRLAAAEFVVSTLEQENIDLRAEVRALSEREAHRVSTLLPTQPAQTQPWEAPLDEAMLALIKGIDTSFARGAAHY